MNNIIRTGFWPALRGIIFPESCLSCGTGLKERHNIAYCQVCLKDVRLIHEPLCKICGKPFEKSGGKSHLCSFCLQNKWYFTRARAAVYYQEPIAGAVKFFKYSGEMYGLKTFAALTHKYFLKHSFPNPDLIIPVPLHTRRLRSRGFNQALILCRKFFPLHKDRIDPFVLERHQWTYAQAGLSGLERRRNVKNAFRIKNKKKIIYKKILLVDDVFTTGATVNECARILLKNKAGEVEVFTFARAVDRK